MSSSTMLARTFGIAILLTTGLIGTLALAPADVQARCKVPDSNRPRIHNDLEGIEDSMSRGGEGWGLPADPDTWNEIDNGIRPNKAPNDDANDSSGNSSSSNRDSGPPDAKEYPGCD